MKVLGWTNQMPELLMSHHLVISKAGGATVQEAIAARCPMIVNQVIPGQEEGNAELITKFNLGAVVEKNKEVAEAVELAFEKRATLWHEWRKNLKKISRPDAALRIGELILEAADHDQPGRKAVKLFETAPDRVMRPARSRPTAPASRRCSFAISTSTPIIPTASSSVPEVIDFYGERGFDCICITDHLADPKRLLGKLVRADQHDARAGTGWRILCRHRTRTPARVAPLQDARADRHRVQQGRLHAQDLRAPARH